jgi:transposase-like protein
MADAIFSAPRFQDDEAARKHLEGIRWPNGPECPHCGGTERNSALNGKAHRAGLYFCGDCRSQFTVTVGTVFADSKIPLHKWVLATHLLCSSKKGMSAHQLHRTIGITYKSAWFMAHRIRKAMETRSNEPMGGSGKIVEADETYWGTNAVGKRNKRVGRRITGGAEKMKIVSLIERGGKARSFHVLNVNAKTLAPILRGQVAPETHLMTDEARAYITIGDEFRRHSTVTHGQGEYVRGNVHTNTAESFFNILKRGLIGTYHHVGEQHLQRYVTEFDFRYNNRTKLGVTDEQRADIALKGISGKRLTYRRTHA